MASVVLNEFKRASAAAEIDLDTGGDTLKSTLVMTNTTCDTENDAIVNPADYSTFDEHGTAGKQTLANQAVNKDDANDRAEFDADDITYSSLAAGARDVQGWHLRKYVDDTDANDLAMAFIQFTSNFSPDGSDLVIAHDAEGILQLT